MTDRPIDDAPRNPGVGVATYAYHGEAVTAEAIARLALLDLYEGGPLDPERTLRSEPFEQMLETLGLRLHEARTRRSAGGEDERRS